jgi:hypothetical protein
MAKRNTKRSPHMNSETAFRKYGRTREYEHTKISEQEKNRNGKGNRIGACGDTKKNAKRTRKGNHGKASAGQGNDKPRSQHGMMPHHHLTQLHDTTSPHDTNA